MAKQRNPKPPEGFTKKVDEFAELAQEKNWSISEGFSPEDLKANSAQVAQLEAEYKRTEAEYRAKKYALKQAQRGLFVQFQTALRMISARFYRDAGVQRLLDSFRRGYTRRKKEMPQTVEV
jgi:hypothetical protein